MFAQRTTLDMLLFISVLFGLATLPIAVHRHRQRLHRLSYASRWHRQADCPIGIVATESLDWSSMALSENASKGKCRSTACCHRLQACVCCAQGLLSLLSGAWLCLLLAAHAGASFPLFSAASTYAATTVTTVYVGYSTMAHIAKTEGNHVQQEWWSSHFISVGLLLVVSANRLESLYMMPQMLGRGRRSFFPFEPPHIWLLQHAGAYRHLSADIPILLVAAAVFPGVHGGAHNVPHLEGREHHDLRALEACAIFCMVAASCSLLSGLLATLHRCVAKWRRRASMTSSLQRLGGSIGEYGEIHSGGVTSAIGGPAEPLPRTPKSSRYVTTETTTPTPSPLCAAPLPQ